MKRNYHIIVRNILNSKILSIMLKMVITVMYTFKALRTSYFKNTYNLIIGEPKK